MLRIDRIACWLFIVYYATAIFSMQIVKPLDELFAIALVGLSLLDCVCNRQWRRYRPMFIVIAVFAFYVLYSLTAVHFNTPAAVLKDFLIELKPFVVAVCAFCIAPRFTPGDKRVLRGIARVLIVVLLLAGISFYSYYNLLCSIFNHVAFIGAFALISALIYIYVSADDEGHLRRSDLVFVLIALAVGLLSTRSKYYVEFVMMLFFLFVYRRGMLRHLTLSTIVILAAVGVLGAAVAWKKLDYYFISVNLSDLDLNNLSSYARVALYLGLGLIIWDYPLFGSGLASFATYPSSESYSSLYGQYGLDKVWGLSPEMPDFICDAYYTSLAQYGAVGIALFVYFWVWLYRNLRAMTRSAGPRWHYPFIVGASVLVFELVELTTGTVGVTSAGVAALFLLGMISASGNGLRQQQKKKKNETLASNKKVKTLPIRI